MRSERAGFGLLDSESFQLAVTDHVPIVAAIADQSFSCLGGVIPVSASDADGDTLRLLLSTSAPQATLLDRQDGSGSIVIGAGIGAGSHLLELSATDQTRGESASASFVLDVTPNLPPAITLAGPSR